MDFPKATAGGLFGVDPVALVRECDRAGTVHFDW
jgi:hypothetical protein